MPFNDGIMDLRRNRNEELSPAAARADLVESESQLDEKLTQLGSQGWELVAICYIGPNFFRDQGN